MLVLTRKLGEKILIGDDIVVTVLDVRGDSIRLGVDAPRGVRIQRDEVVRAVAEANVAASHTDDSAEERIKASLGGILGTATPAGSAPTSATEATADDATVEVAVPVAVRPRPRPSASVPSLAVAQAPTA
ncbi:carbon storage regulator CsrA [Leifsonia sp. YAF41]|uniref:carbon storage regulator CsrA n=1 Tax=Leifsonia sp. YAF41 TaxID=3233086 RepID=UPI003F9C0553